jgi:hypothetical protein
LPDLGYVILVLQLAATVACAWFMWRARLATLEMRELLDTERDLLAELKEAIAAADTKLSPAPAVEENAASAGGDERSALVLGLTKLGLDSAEIANQLGISRGEASLLIRMAGRHVNRRV